VRKLGLFIKVILTLDFLIKLLYNYINKNSDLMKNLLNKLVLGIKTNTESVIDFVVIYTLGIMVVAALIAVPIGLIVRIARES